MTDFTINIQLDLKKDARNYRKAFNANTHSNQRKDHIATLSGPDFQKIIGMDEQQTYIFLREYLENFWEKNKDVAQQKIREMKNIFDQKKNNIFERMATLTKHPIYRNNFTIFLTSLNRWPYNYNLWYTWSYLHWTWVLRAFTHELLHFQTIHYYKEYILSNVHDEKKFEDLKEALTFLLNYEFTDIIENPDLWYPQHQELRKKLEDYRVNSDKDFEQLITYWCSFLA